MGKSYTPITFFSDTIEIVPHTCTHAEHIDRPVSIAEFADGRPVSLSVCDETGEYFCEVAGDSFDFMEGPEHG